MRTDDFKKLATGTVLFNLNRLIAPKLVTILYFLGLAAILLWAIAHFFSTFRFGVGSGLWGLLEIAVYGLLAMIALRIGCEAVIVYFDTHAPDAEDLAPARSTGSLLDDVREAIEDLVEEEDRSTPSAPAPVAPDAAGTPRPATDTPATVEDNAGPSSPAEPRV